MNLLPAEQALYDKLFALVGEALKTMSEAAVVGVLRMYGSDRCIDTGMEAWLENELINLCVDSKLTNAERFGVIEEIIWSVMHRP